jgi:hypothetical protein
MLFNEIIDEHGIEAVASTTNISSVNLRYLYEEDFGRLNRVKALGFLLILEREYKDIDVSELREKIKKYYDEHRPVDDKVVMVAKDSVEEGGFSFFKLFVILALLGGGYYLYTEGKLDSIMQNIQNKEEFFDDEKALENNITEEDANKVIVGESDSEAVQIEAEVAPKVETVNLNVETDRETQANEAVTEVNQLASISTSESNQSIESVVKEVSAGFLANKAENKVEENQENNTSTPTTITTVNVNPTRGMLWFGFINLDTKKRREFMKKVSTPFNINGSRWLLVTGHGYVDVIADEKTVELADNKKHYFYVDSNEIKEITKSEFRELNGNRGW